MKLIATDEEMLKLAYDVLCSGLTYFVSYGFVLNYSESEYNTAHKALITNGVKHKDMYVEAVQTQMLRMGYGLIFKNVEENTNHVLTLDLIKKNWDNIPITRIMAVVNEDYDAEDTDVIAQSILFGEIIYG